MYSSIIAVDNRENMNKALTEGIIMTKKRIDETVEEICRPITDRLGLNLIDIEYKKEGKDYVLRAIIDKADGIVIEDCENVSRELSDKLDEIDPIEGGYLLEVQSPGERSLKKDREFDYFRDRSVEVKLYEAVDGKKVFEGRLLGLEDNKVKLMSDNNSELEFPKDKVANVKLKINF